MRYMLRGGVAATAALLLSALFPQTASAESTTTISVSYGSPTPDGLPVTVSGTGFVPGAFLRLLQCGPDLGLEPDLRTALDECDLSQFVTPTVDAQGNVQPSVLVLRQMVAGADCLVTQCFILLGQLAGPDGFLTAVAPVRLVPRTPESKTECKDGGWRDLTNDQRQPFRNEGLCVSSVVARRA